MKAILVFILSLFALSSYGQISTPGRGGGNNSGAGSITNLSPQGATLYSTATSVTNATNFYRQYNMFTTAVATNMDASAAGGYIRVTNAGIYELSIALTYRQNTNQGGNRTNIFAVSTNAGGINASNATLVAGRSYTTATNTLYYSFSMFGAHYLPSNTYITFSFQNVTAPATNDLAFETVALSAALLGGSTTGTGGGGTLSSISAANTIYVDAENGSDTTGLRERFTSPVATLTNALALAVSGDLIVVRPSFYALAAEVTLPLKSNVKWYFEPNSTVTQPDGGGGFGSPFSLFNDFNGTATNCGVYGYGRFFSTNSSGPIWHQTNANTDAYFEFAIASQVGQDATITREGGNLKFRGHELLKSLAYDAFDDNGVTTTNKHVHGDVKRIEFFDSLIEMAAPFASPGDLYLRFDEAEKTGKIAAGGIEIRDGAIIEGGAIVLPERGIIAGYGPAGNGIIRNLRITANPTNHYPIVGTPEYVSTALTLEGCYVTGSTNVDPIFVNYGQGAFTMIDTTVTGGVTNSARATNSQIIASGGTLRLTKPLQSGVTIGGLESTATNHMHRLQLSDSAVVGGRVTVVGDTYLPSLTVSKVPYVDSGGKLAPVTGSGTYVKADGTTGDPAGSGDVSAAANFGTDNAVLRADGTSKGAQSSPVIISDGGAVSGVDSILNTNGTYSLRGGFTVANTNLGTATNVTLVLTNGPHSATYMPAAATSGVFTVTFASPPAAGSPADIWNLEIYNTNTSAAVGYWIGTFDTRGNAPVLISGPSTNSYELRWNGTNLYVFSRQELTAPNSTGPILLQTNNNYASFGALNVITNLNAASATITNRIELLATNGNSVYIRAASSNAVSGVGTNIIGVVHKAAATPLFLDAFDSWQFVVTNRIGAPITLVLTNSFDRYEASILLIGEAASGGASRTVTIVGSGGGSAAIANLDTFGTAIGASMAFTLTNGNAVEINAKTFRMLQSNVTAVVTRQFAY